MLTRCPECSTSFRVTAEQLRLAQGAVRCGNCEAVFDALTTLSDDQPENAVDQTQSSHGGVESTEDSPTGAADSDSGGPSTTESVDYDELSGQLAGYFRETDEPEESDEPGAVAADDTVPSAPKFPSDSELSESRQHVSAETGTADQPAADEIDDTIDTTAEEDQLSRIFDEVDDDRPVFVVEGEIPSTSSPESDYGNAAEAPDQTIAGPSTEPAKGSGVDKVTDLEDYSEYSQDLVARSDGVEQDETADPGIPGWQDLSPTSDSGDKERNAAIVNNGWWTVGAAVLLVTLLMQLVHSNRDTLATHARYGAAVQLVYASLDIPLYPEWDLLAYEIRGSEAVSGESQAGVLDVRAQMMIKGTEAVGEPLLRIVLRDRWSNLVARGVFSASEYRSDGTSAGSLLRPGEMLPISVSVEDPGDAAQGYELDLCVMTRYAGLKCDRKAER